MFAKFLLSFPAVAAAEMPTGAKRKLQEILSREEFHPRRIGKDFWDTVWDYLGQWVVEVLQWFRDIFSFSSGNVLHVQAELQHPLHERSIQIPP